MNLNLLFNGSCSLLFLIIISGCGAAMTGVTGVYNLQGKGQIIPSEQIEMYKNMPEDSPALKSLREQAAKDPEGMLAVALKCAGRLCAKPLPNGHPDKWKEYSETQTCQSSSSAIKKDSEESINKTGTDDCYWKPPFLASWKHNDSNPFSAQQDSMTRSLKSALINLGNSQIIMAKALGLNEQVILAEKNAKNLEKGDLGAASEIDKALEISGTVQEAIDKETAKKKSLDVESKKVFITSIPFYIKGVTTSVQTGIEAASISTNLINLNPTALLQVGALYSIVKNLPGLVTQLAGSTGKIMDFMTVNDIDNSEMKDQLAGVF
jgi:hypothetical protein